MLSFWWYILVENDLSPYKSDPLSHFQWQLFLSHGYSDCPTAKVDSVGYELFHETDFNSKFQN